MKKIFFILLIFIFASGFRFNFWVKPTPTPIPTPTVIPTPAPDYSLQVGKTYKEKTVWNKGYFTLDTYSNLMLIYSLRSRKAYVVNYGDRKMKVEEERAIYRDNKGRYVKCLYWGRFRTDIWYVK